jgi:hypothetical protein
METQTGVNEMTMEQMKAVANRAGMPVTTDVRAIAARAFLAVLHAKNSKDAAACGAALDKAVKRFGKP